MEMTMEVDKLQTIIDLIFDYGWEESAHHKQWLIDQILQVAAGDDYTRLVKQEERAGDPDEFCEWDRGIMP